MSGTDASWTGAWIAERVSKHSDVVSATLLEPQVLEVQVKGGRKVVVGTVATLMVTKELLEELFWRGHDFGFIVNVPKESYWTGDAIQLVVGRHCAFGGVGDLNRALAEDSPRDYVFREYAFIERGLQQHTAVDRLERLADRKYLIHRARRSSVCVVFLDAYELTADHVRTARERYGAFDHVVRSNPNGRSTRQAIDAAKSMGVSVLDWRQLLGRLNSE